MTTPLNATRTPRLIRLSPLRTLAITALLGNALLFAFNAVPSAPEGHNIPHLILSLMVAVIIALRFHWTPALGVLACAAQLLEGLIFLGAIRAAVDSPATFAFAALFFVFPVVGLITCIATLIQEYRTRQSFPTIA